MEFRSFSEVYPGFTAVEGDILDWRALVRGPLRNIAWDFLINLSGSDYPLRSVESMRDVLFDYGAASHIEGFVRTHGFARARVLSDIAVDCPSEPCSGGTAGCVGYIKWLQDAYKPPITGS